MSVLSGYVKREKIMLKFFPFLPLSIHAHVLSVIHDYSLRFLPCPYVGFGIVVWAR